MHSLSHFHAEIRRALGADRHRLKRQLRSLEQAQQSGRENDRNLARFQQELERSQQAREARLKGIPQIQFEQDLPINLRRDDIVTAIRDNQVVVICGETGSGKSTQLPKICLSMGRGVDGLIGHTQPRRIAARSVAGRIAEELSVPLGREVGFKIRFTDSTNSQTYIKLMTDGILLAESQHDRFLDQYDTLILDEAHERSLNIDFLLGYVHRLLPKRPDFRLIITSATIDAERFSEHFRIAKGPAPIVQVSGRTYPVDVWYRPLEQEEDQEDPDWQRAVLKAVDELAAIDSGNMLIFMPTERDIHETARMLRGKQLPEDLPGRLTQIVPLYARLSAAEQNRVFQPSTHRRIVIATNVAESSLTVPGIHYVIDPGTARISRYAPRSKVQRLPIEPISQASADQRKGRCGRIAPGICIRLYSESDYLTREKFTAPEIQRTNLASVILQTLALKLGDIAEFPFLDPPKPDAVKDGYNTLFELGAIDDKRQLTDLGRRLSPLPVDPRIGRIVLAGHEENCLREILIIASALEVQDPRERPLEKQQAADEAHKQFEHEESDFLAYLKLWDFYDQADKDLSRSKLRDACHKNFLSYNRMREWIDVHLQLWQLVEQAGMKPGQRRDDYTAIHRALLTGLLSNVALKGETHEYTQCGGAKAHLWPGSGVFKKAPRWVMAGEVVETSRRYLRTAARIDPVWIESLAGHIVTRTYSEPHWSAEAGNTLAFEKVSLFGLVVMPRRRVAYGSIDPVLSRELLIRHGLVEGDLRTHGRFLQQNRELREQLAAMQTKTRRSDLMIDDERCFEFFNALIPADVFDLPRFEKWRKQAERENPRLLCLSEENLLAEPLATVPPADFPDSIAVRQMQLDLEYKFDPGAATDGITLTIPQEGLNQLDAHRVGWLVPGLLEEKIVALIRALPKENRVAFIPIAETAKRVLKELKFGQGSLEGSVAEILTRIGQERISHDLFRQAQLPDHLRMNVRVLDTKGETLAAGRDLDQLRRMLGTQASRTFSAQADPRWTRDGIVAWDFGEFPAQVELQRGGLALCGYPVLVDTGEAVSLRLFDDAERAAAATRGGLRRLFYLAVRKEIRSQIEWLPNLERTLLLATGLAPIQNRSASAAAARPFKQQLGELLVERAFLSSGDVPRSAEQFQKHLVTGRKRIGLAVQDLAALIEPLMESLQAARVTLEQCSSPAYRYALDDGREQFRQLLAGNFLVDTPWDWLIHFPRYFQGLDQRLKRLQNAGLARDQRLFANIQPLWTQYLALAASQTGADSGLSAGGLAPNSQPKLTLYRWLLEEYRVSLFAQELGTAVPVSEKRLAKLWEEIRERG